MFSKEAESIVEKKHRKRSIKKEKVETSEVFEAEPKQKRSKKPLFIVLGLAVIVAVTLILVFVLLPGQAQNVAYINLNTQFESDEYKEFLANANTIDSKIQDISTKVDFKNLMSSYDNIIESGTAVRNLINKDLAFAVTGDTYSSLVNDLNNSLSSFKKNINKANDYFKSIVLKDINEYWINTYGAEFLKLYRNVIEDYIKINKDISDIYCKCLPEGLNVNRFGRLFVTTEVSWLNYILTLNPKDSTVLLEQSTANKVFVMGTLSRGMYEYSIDSDLFDKVSTISNLNLVKHNDKIVTFDMLFPLMVDSNKRTEFISEISENLNIINDTFEFLGGNI